MADSVFPEGEWLRRRAQHSPDQPAIITADDTQHSYASFDRVVAQTATELVADGCGSGDQIAIVCSDSFTTAKLVFATIRIGAVAVPINTRLSAETIVERVNRVAPHTVIIDDEIAAILPSTSDFSVEPTRTTVLQSSSSDQSSFSVDRSAADPWLMLYTSGTTGDPNLVVLTEQNLRASAIASVFRLGLDNDDRWFDPLPLYHMGGLAPVFRSVLYGTTVVLTDSFNPERAHERMRTHSVTGISVVPTMLRDLLATDDMPDLRFVLCGGAATPPTLINRCTAAGIPIYPTYGMTETASQIATATPDEVIADSETVGRPLFNMDVSIVGPNGRCDPGTPGEIVVAGPAVSPGYYDNPDQFDARTSTYGFHTGDRGLRKSDGQLVVLGRSDRTIVTGGENVDPREVREVLLSHSAVSAAAVVGIDDDHWGQRVAAAVVGDTTPERVHEYCREQLAGFKLPRRICIIDSLPRTASGTVDYEAVARQLTESGTDIDADY